MDKYTLIISILALLISLLGYVHTRKINQRQTRISLEQRRQTLRVNYHDIALKLSTLTKRLLEKDHDNESIALVEKFSKGLEGLMTAKKSLESLSLDPVPFIDYSWLEQEMESLKGDAIELSSIVDRAWAAYKANDAEEMKLAANGIYVRVYGSKGDKA